ncbi:ornithine cyclodeaminase family protein [Microbacterium trichothecenolyticum]|uniref:1-piperideine-2-carboxylate/1-pyrroline-2-carboxylate reductase [NAD(P)H] n=1 Tax=Microbacterium trichothecenolyticum TaxID=69370 RepID=A0ABU0TS71_MICTR|nr:ornithine cyclodeaminase family protein [Microbacterium trichothecenolyticum]MDQ1122512.1 1-piperideine-2-carboxylate/1-pyrroline-2-carboxylate reductase [NAD(P)H] [Microbacterium trichothecenolyticum]
MNAVVGTSSAETGESPGLPGDIAFIDAAAIREIAHPRVAVAAITAALRDGLDPEADQPRLSSPLPVGEFLLLPAHSRTHAGLKTLTVAPHNPAAGAPKIQGWYLLFDGSDLRPVAVLEGAALTLVRTPAVTAVAIRGLLGGEQASPSIALLTVIGTGPQAEAHVRTLAAVVPVQQVAVLGRRSDAAAALAARLSDTVPARVATDADLRASDVVITATSSSTPVLGLDDIGADAIVAAVGAHGLDHREIDATLVRAADVIVEGRASALRENGNLMQARPVDEWESGVQSLTTLAELVRSRPERLGGRPALYTGVGMAWEDLVMAERIVAERRRTPHVTVAGESGS